MTSQCHLRDERGAVAAEFVVAITPLMMMFFVFLEFMRMSLTSVALQYSAFAGVRAASVMVDMNPNVRGDDRNIELAVLDAIGNPEKRSATLRDITVISHIGARTQDDPNAMDIVRVSAIYRCVMPFAKAVLCTGSGKTLRAESSFPHQGARYLR